jgi:hypothetical protein
MYFDLGLDTQELSMTLQGAFDESDRLDDSKHVVFAIASVLPLS